MIIDPGSTGGGDEVEYYPVTDVQGTVYKLFDASGVEVADYTYSPFGQRLTNTSLTTPPSTPPYMPLGFGGTYSDDDIGLLYAKSRYYDPHTTRFTTKDSYRGSKGSIISQNRYIYCHQNPILYADPAGYAPVEGDHADPCTTTDQDIHYEPDSSDLLPPEDLPNMVMPEGEHEGWSKHWSGSWIPDGKEANDDGSYFIKIGDYKIRVRATEDGNGNLQFSFYTVNTDNIYYDRKDASALADGLNDGINDPAFGDIVQRCIEYDPMLFESTLDKFMSWGWADDARSGYGMSMREFGHAFMGGYAVAAQMYNEFSDKKIINVQAVIDHSHSASGMTVWETMVMNGLWNTYFNSSSDTEGGRVTLDIMFKGDGIQTGDLDSPVGLLELSQVTYFTWYFWTSAAVADIYDTVTSKDEKGNDVIVDIFSTVKTVAYICGVSVLPDTLSRLFTTVRLFWNPSGGTDSLDMMNQSGITRKMLETLYSNGNRPAHYRSGTRGLRRGYCASSTAMAFATVADWYNIDMYDTSLYQGDMVLGDLFTTSTDYMHGAGAAINEMDGGQWQNMTNEALWSFIVGGEDFNIFEYNDWVEDRYFWKYYDEDEP